MILSVSRRTDIPAFFPNWFMQRLKEGVVYVQNPFNHKVVYSVELDPVTVDFIVFWTKNPAPILNLLHEINKLGYTNYCFLYTLNNYKTLELNLPSLSKRIESFKKLSDTIGKEKVIWRYDPIVFSKDYTYSFHAETFARLTAELSDFTRICKTSFLTHYAKIKNRVKNEQLKKVTTQEKVRLIKLLQQIAGQHNIKLELCCEELEGFSQLNTGCINKGLIEELLSANLDLKRDKNQRNNCRCISSIDIGAYNTCNHQCKYCYANSGNLIKSNKNLIYSPMLAKEYDVLTQNLLDRKIQSNKISSKIELKLF